MKKITFFITLLCSFQLLFAQASKNEISVSIPLIWQSVKVNNLYTDLGQPKTIDGTGFGSGINIAYNRFLYKGLFVIGGVGYYKERFNIHRKLEYATRDFIDATNSYNYQNIHLLFGLGYKVPISKNWNAKGSITYNEYSTFKQVYYVGLENKINNNTYSFGNSYLCSLGIYKKVYKKISVGLNLLLPLKTQWRKDAIFKENPDEYYSPKFGLGAGISANYSF